MNGQGKESSSHRSSLQSGDFCEVLDDGTMDGRSWIGRVVILTRVNSSCGDRNIPLCTPFCPH